ncbi:MAG: pyridoxamine 5'-phosphate oxidase family protein [Treponema sp.]|nr:pyridoxamine 5'-phosphate oxidase family protein [Treponema sp.]
MKEVHDFIKKCGTYYLATVEGDQPRNRPFGTINIFDGKLYIQTGKSKEVSKQIQKNPKVEISCFDGPSGQWLRLAGELVRDERREAKVDMLEHYPDLKKMYSADDDNTEVLYFKNATATIYSFGGAPRVIKID